MFVIFPKLVVGLIYPLNYNQPMAEEIKETKQTISKFKQARGSHKVRLAVIVVLLVIVVVLFFVWEKARLGLAIAFIALLAALGLEVTQQDWDLNKLWETKSFEASKVQRDEEGNVLYDTFGNITTDTTQGKKADDYNCDDFDSQPAAQAFFDKVGGVGNDVNRLDGDKDGEACESLPKGSK